MMPRVYPIKSNAERHPCAGLPHEEDSRMRHEPPLTVGIQGASGRMGARIIQLIQLDSSLRLGAALDRSDHPNLGEDVGASAGLGPLGIPLSASLDRPVDVMIDFSTPAGTLALAQICCSKRIPLVVGTTGFEPEHRREIESAARTIPLLM